MLASNALKALPSGIFCITFLSSAFFLKNLIENYFRNTIRVSNSLDPDQVQSSVWPDLDPN